MFLKLGLIMLLNRLHTSFLIPISLFSLFTLIRSLRCRIMERIWIWNAFNRMKRMDSQIHIMLCYEKRFWKSEVLRYFSTFIYILTGDKNDLTGKSDKLPNNSKKLCYSTLQEVRNDDFELFGLFPNVLKLDRKKSIELKVSLDTFHFYLVFK